MSDHRDSEPKDVLSFGPFSLFVAERLLKKGDERYRSVAARSTS